MKINTQLRDEIFQVIKNQIKSNTPPETKITYDRLIASGYSEFETNQQIEITVTENERLVIKNNLQRKVEKPVSHKIGLNNIAVKYQLMQQEEIIVKEEHGYFIVSLPLIHPSANREKMAFPVVNR